MPFGLGPVSSPCRSPLRPAWPRPHSPAALGHGGHDIMAGTEGPSPGFHAGTLQLVLGFLMRGAPQHGLRLGSRGPAGWHAGQSGWGREWKQMTRIRRALTLLGMAVPEKALHVQPSSSSSHTEGTRPGAWP